MFRKNDQLVTLNAVSDFYERAFTRLLAAAGLFLGITGVAIPIVIQYLQSESIRNKKEEIQTELKWELKNARSELKDEVVVIKQEFERLRAELRAQNSKQAESSELLIESKVTNAARAQVDLSTMELKGRLDRLDKIIDLMECSRGASTDHAYASIAFTQGYFPEAIKRYASTIGNYMIVGDKRNISNALGGISASLRAAIDKRQKVKKDTVAYVRQVVADVKRWDHEGIFSDRIDEIKPLLESEDLKTEG